MSEREALAIPAFDDDLDDFAPRQDRAQDRSRETGRDKAGAAPARHSIDTQKAVDSVSKFPSREASSDGQLNLKGPQHILDRFKAMCKADRRAYYDMLEILMDRYE